MTRSLTLTSRRLYIDNSWIRDAISEFLATFIFGVMLSSAATHETLAGWHAGSGFVLNISAGLSLAMIVYVSGNASGAYANPGIAIIFALVGKLKWKKFPMYVLVEMLAMYMGCAVVYLVYYDNINAFDGGMRAITGPNATASIFASFPTNDFVSTTSMFFEVMIGHCLLALFILAIVDPDNMGVTPALLPIPIGMSVMVACSGFSHNSGCAINPAKDFSGRLLLASVGYGHEVFTYGDYWMWVSPIACTCGAVLATVVYQCVIGLQWPPASPHQSNQFQPVELRPLKAHEHQ